MEVLEDDTSRSEPELPSTESTEMSNVVASDVAEESALVPAAGADDNAPCTEVSNPEIETKDSTDAEVAIKEELDAPPVHDELSVTPQIQVPPCDEEEENYSPTEGTPMIPNSQNSDSMTTSFYQSWLGGGKTTKHAEHASTYAQGDSFVSSLGKAFGKFSEPLLPMFNTFAERWSQKSPLPIVDQIPDVISNERYAAFLHLLETEKAQPLRNKIRDFEKNILASETPVDGPEFQAFIQECGPFLQSEPFSIASVEDMNLAFEALERRLSHILYRVLYPNKEDLEPDMSLSRRIEQLSFITPEHLDVSPQLLTPSMIQKAQEHLFSLLSVKSPAEKMMCLQRCVRAIQIQGQYVGADIFFPMLIYIVLRSNPPAILSNLRFIERYRRLSPLEEGELGYCFISVKAAVVFIQELNANQVSNLEEEQFKKMLADGRQGLKAVPRPATLDDVKESDDLVEADWVVIKKRGNPVYLSTHTLIGDEIDEAELYQKRSIWTKKTLDTLTPDELELVFEDYKRLVRMHHASLADEHHQSAAE